MAGLTKSLTIGIPEWMAGSRWSAMSAGIVSLLGIRLNTLFNEKGQTSRTATSPHRRQEIHFGAFFNSSLARKTARISQLAVMLIFSIQRNAPLTLTPPSGMRRSFSVSRLLPRPIWPFGR